MICDSVNTVPYGSFSYFSERDTIKLEQLMGEFPNQTRRFIKLVRLPE